MQVKVWMASGPVVFSDLDCAIAVRLTAKDIGEILKAKHQGDMIHCCAPPGHKLLRDSVQMQLFAVDGWDDPPARTKIITQHG